MIKNNFKKDGGLVKLVILIIIAIVVLSYFGFDIKNIIESDQTQDNLGYVWGFVVMVWNDYLKEPVSYFWNEIFLELLWDSFKDNFERIKNNEPTDFELNAPSVDTGN